MSPEIIKRLEGTNQPIITRYTIKDWGRATAQNNPLIR